MGMLNVQHPVAKKDTAKCYTETGKHSWALDLEATEQ